MVLFSMIKSLLNFLSLGIYTVAALMITTSRLNMNSQPKHCCKYRNCSINISFRLSFRLNDGKERKKAEVALSGQVQFWRNVTRKFATVQDHNCNLLGENLFSATSPIYFQLLVLMSVRLDRGKNCRLIQTFLSSFVSGFNRLFKTSKKNQNKMRKGKKTTRCFKMFL